MKKKNIYIVLFPFVIFGSLTETKGVQQKTNKSFESWAEEIQIYEADKQLLHEGVNGEFDFFLGQSLKKNIIESSKLLVITFTGMGWGMGPGLPPFQFQKTLSEFDVSTIFVRDLRREFYQFGISSKGNISSLLETLKAEIDETGACKIIVIGNSGGGYAALLFGFLLYEEGYPIFRVHSFSPKNVVRKNHLTYNSIEPEFFYLRKVFQNSTLPKGIFHVYYALDSLEDAKYAQENLNYDWVYHHIYEKGGHGIVTVLKKNGTLLEIIADSIYSAKSSLN